MNLRSAIPFALAAPTLAWAQSSVSIYGVADVAATYTNRVASSPGSALTAVGTTANRYSISSGVLLGSRLGFRGSEDLGGGLRANFGLESGINMDTGTIGQGGIFWGRRAFAGISGPFGSVMLGRMRELQGDAFVLFNGVLDFGNVVLKVHDNSLDRSVGGGRVNNAVRVDTPAMAGFTGSLIYGFGEANTFRAGQSAGFTGMYASGRWTLGLGYYQSRLGPTPSDSAQSTQGALAGAPGDAALRSLTVGARYELPTLHLYGSYSDVRQPLAGAAATPSFAAVGSFLPNGSAFTAGGSNNHRTKILDVGAKWRPFDPALSLLGGVQYERVSFVAAADGQVTQFNVGVDYALSKRTDVYALVAHQRAESMFTPGILDGPTGRSRTQYAAAFGIRHVF